MPRKIDGLERQIFELHLAGESIKSMAIQMRVNEKTVRRQLDQAGLRPRRERRTYSLDIGFLKAEFARLGSVTLTARSLGVPASVVSSRLRAAGIKLDWKKSHRAAFNVKFQSRIDKRGPNDCWLWTGGINKFTGYGRAMYRRRRIPAHRYAFMLANNIEHLEKWQFVCHKCDNPPCCNPNHLFLGTQADNMQDMLSKGRDNYCRGERSPSRKLSWEQVQAVKSMAEAGELSQREIARQFDIHQVTVSKILNGIRWRRRR